MLLGPNQIGQWLRSVDQHDAASVVEQCFLREDFVDLIEPIHGGKEVELFNVIIETPGHIFKLLNSDLAACADQVEYAVRGCAAGVGVSVRHINWVPMVPPAQRPTASSSVVSPDTSVEVLRADSPPANKSFDVFLSHNSKDKPAVRELAKALVARGLKVWLDEWELVPGRPWQESLEEIIETTQSAAVLVGKDGFGPWQDVEMRGCLEEFVYRKLPVMPVLLPGVPEKPKLPIFLKRFTWVDLRGGLTESGVDQLQWGITGSRPDLSGPQPPPPALEVQSLEAQEFSRELIMLKFQDGLDLLSTSVLPVLNAYYQDLLSKKLVGVEFLDSQVGVEKDSLYNALHDRLEKCYRTDLRRRTEKLESWLVEGVRKTLNYTYFKDRQVHYAFQSCFWFARAIRSWTLWYMRLALTESERLENTYGSGAMESPLLGSKAVMSEFYGRKLIKLDLWRREHPDDEQRTSVFFPMTGYAGSWCHDHPQCREAYHPHHFDPEEFYNFLVPQMMVRHFVNKEAIITDWTAHWIGCS